MPFSIARFRDTMQSRHGTTSIQAVNCDTVELAVTATPARIADLLEAAGWHTRWGYATIEQACADIVAVVFYRPASALALRAKSADTVTRPIPAGEDTYIPSLLVYGQFLSTVTPGNYLVEILHANPRMFD